MSKEQLLAALKSKDQSVEKISEQNPYSQKGLANHIEDCGFPVDEVLDISAIAESLKSPVLDTNPELKHEDTRNHLTALHKHLAAQGRLPIEKSNKIQEDKESLPVNKQLNMKAMEHIIAKYKGKK